ncbi:MAG: hypothetical protein O2782_13615, partial [bacterium]|nr:hypothetical protein [bacterium]
LSAVPVANPGSKRDRVVLTGDVPSPSRVPSGCPFHPRCPEAIDACSRVVPELADPGDGRRVACLLRTPYGDFDPDTDFDPNTDFEPDMDCALATRQTHQES